MRIRTTQASRISARFPNFFSLDARVTKDVKVTDKYTFRFGVSGSNLTDHFNPISVHANTSDPAYGIFFGEYRRRYTADFDVPGEGGGGGPGGGGGGLGGEIFDWLAWGFPPVHVCLITHRVRALVFYLREECCFK